MDLLLLSNSTSDDGYLVHAADAITELADGQTEALFVPFAGVTRDWDEYAAQVREAFAPLGIAIRSLHEEKDALAAVNAARLILVGGGNTFRLLQVLRQQGLLAPMAARVRSGAARYIGWSAGSNLATPTIRTTNDMPVVDPGGFDALGLVPFQINPHYFNVLVPGFRGETRDQRLAEFTTMSPATPVLGLPEGDWVRVSDDRYTLHGAHAARWFLGTQTWDVTAGALSLPA
ncbi:dipeptidase E [Cupriavidus sp. YR651]|uniref:dipeptidase PepE n=1 Tax=Cupriavidus sp. YR651 TaxID=1855315 RepID=UPI00088B808E|nr:dipeptidase PepE [Cupriavidus sp. YR651]SDD90874.1 dipeptidase E [Cupriavidus sp. YR651]